ncbi:MAG TPA: 50S ribosomal protein L15 [Clostridiales bacterium]|jgi:large subunit ribosomal protein L15|nr:50S ribosomal protein L15 [Clostridiales bacterium]HQP70233.1 50S ribosomal protein L15 [Clostridiales bacterium]
MKLNELRPPKGAVKERHRIGRGVGSGNGKTAGKGEKGQKARSGYSRALYSEGGQTPLTRRLPKRGFKNRFRVEYTVVNVGVLETLTENVITPEVLYSKGMIKNGMPLKVLGNGTLTKSIEVHADSFSKSAEEKINTAKGKVVKL